MSNVIELKPPLLCRFNADIELRARTHQEVDAILKKIKDIYGLDIYILMWDESPPFE